MPKLTDTQRVILSAAAKRDDGAALPLPKSLKLQGAAARRVLAGLCKKALLAEQPATPEAPAWREAEGARRIALVITEAGLQAIGVGPGDGARKQADRTEVPAKKERRRAVRPAGAPKPMDKASCAAARPGTKQALLIGLLNREGGATIAEAVAATGWQPHSVRGAISGALKKRLGPAVTSEPVEGRGRVYRIAAGR